MPTADSKRRWFCITPDRFVIGLLVMICLLWLSERFQWFGFNHHKGWTVLIAVAAVGVAALVMLVWWATGLIFGWRFQFSIRSLLVFCLACSIAVSWLAVEMRQARQQAEMVKWIRNSGGWVAYDWEVDEDNFLISNSEPPEPRWLRTTLGDDFFSRVVTVDGIGTAITDVGLEHLTELKELREMYLLNTSITDAGLEHLKEMTQLQVLSLFGSTKVTEAGLEHLKGLTQLERLFLQDTNTTDAVLEYLEGLTQLRDLDIVNTKVSAAGVKKLQQALPNCKIYH